MYLLPPIDEKFPLDTSVRRSAAPLVDCAIAHPSIVHSTRGEWDRASRPDHQDAQDLVL